MPTLRLEPQDLRNESDPHLLVEHFQDLLAGTSLQKLTVHFQALDSLLAPFRRTQLQRPVFGRIVFARLC